MPGVIAVPNLLSLARLPLAAVFLLVPDTAVRVAVIVAAGVSDYLDGWWARTRGPRTRTGAVLDPVTDKAFIVTALVAFAVDGTITPLGLLVLLARDICVAVGLAVILLARSGMRLEARYPGKVLTTIQFAAIVVLTLLPAVAVPVIVVAGVVSVWAIADYATAGLDALRAPRRQG
ncbi:MAG TPA: CDP-alcohol phosphatidyltransferase family protein [Longimicrobiales bacterium]|nr:CDP-alcohol phosphatidyltransferase family protein [Longimicrobiales bacterium]